MQNDQSLHAEWFSWEGTTEGHLNPISLFKQSSPEPITQDCVFPLAQEGHIDHQISQRLLTHEGHHQQCPSQAPGHTQNCCKLLLNFTEVLLATEFFIKNQLVALTSQSQIGS